MALSKDKKNEIVGELVELLKTSKMTVVASYEGMTVRQMQELRRAAAENGTTIKVVKNRLVRKAVEQVEAISAADTSELTNMLVYAFNSEDEVAGAQTLKQYAKTAPMLTFVGAISGEGKFLVADEVKMLADLPSKEQLRAQLVGTINAPLSGFANVLAGNVRGVLNVLNARSESISQ